MRVDNVALPRPSSAVHQPRPTTRIDAFDAALGDLLAPANPASPSPQEPTEGLSFSRHARARLESRGIALSQDDIAELAAAVDVLAGKGARESLLLQGDHAFVVGVPKRTVITALSRTEAVGNVFTQIDSTLVVR